MTLMKNRNTRNRVKQSCLIVGGKCVFADQLIKQVGDYIEFDIYDFGNSTVYKHNGQVFNFGLNWLDHLGVPFMLLRRFMGFFYLKKQFRPKYDILQYFYIKHEYSILFRLLNQYGAKKFAHIFGSDFRNNRFRNILFRFYQSTDKLVFTNYQVQQEFINYYGTSFLGKTVSIPFGIEQLDFIDKASVEIVEPFSKTSKNNLTITIGSSRNVVEQHSEILAQLMSIESTPQNVYFVFPMTYGGAVSHKIRVDLEDFARKHHVRVITDFLSNEELAWLNLQTDIFISLRSSDQYSAALMEYLYAGAVVITGSWLPYQPMKKLGMKFLEAGSMSELPVVLHHAMSNLNELKAEFACNKSIVSKNFRWEKLRRDWLSLVYEMPRTVLT